jgi:hypothetical protein
VKKTARVMGSWSSERGRGVSSTRDGDGKNTRDIYKAVAREGRKDAG